MICTLYFLFERIIVFVAPTLRFYSDTNHQCLRIDDEPGLGIIPGGHDFPAFSASQEREAEFHPDGRCGGRPEDKSVQGASCSGAAAWYLLGSVLPIGGSCPQGRALGGERGYRGRCACGELSCDGGLRFAYRPYTTCMRAEFHQKLDFFVDLCSCFVHDSSDPFPPLLPRCERGRFGARWGRLRGWGGTDRATSADAGGVGRDRDGSGAACSAAGVGAGGGGGKRG